MRSYSNITVEQLIQLKKSGAIRFNEIICSSNLKSKDYEVYTIESLKKRLESDKSELNEVILPGFAMKFHMDIEFVRDSEKDFGLFLEIVENINEVFAEDSFNIIICTASRRLPDNKYKHSFHLVINDLVFDDSLRIKNAIKQYLSSVEGIDLNVYHSGRGTLRIFNTIKGDDKTSYLRQLKGKLGKTYSSNRLEDHLITYFEHNSLDTMKDIGQYRFDPAFGQSYTSNEICNENKHDCPSLADIKDILDKLPQNYRDDRKLWLNIGFALQSIINCENKNEVINMFHDFSRRSQKYNRKSCDDIFTYKSALTQKITIATLFGYAKQEGIKIKPISAKIDESKVFDEVWDFMHHYHAKYIKNVPELVEEFKKYARYHTSKSLCFLFSIDNNGERSFDVQKRHEFNENANEYYIYINKPQNAKVSIKDLPDMTDKIFEEIDSENIIKLTFKELFKRYAGDFKIKAPYFDPGNQISKPGSLNLYRGLLAEYSTAQKDNEALKTVLNHIKIILANKDDKIYHFILSWLARIVQKPGDKTCVALVFVSSCGAGKNIFFNFFAKKVIGSNNSIIINKIQDVAGNFNSCIENRILTILDECTKNDYNTDREQLFDVMKNLITEKKIAITKKHKDIVQDTEDFNNYILFSNHKDCLKLDRTDRRYAIFECNNDYGENRQYFDKLASCLTDGAAKALWEYLTNYEYQDIRDIPKTELKEEMLQGSLDIIDRFFIDKVNIIANSSVGGITATNLYELFKNYHTKLSEGKIRTIQAFGKKCSLILDKSRNMNNISYTLNKEKYIKYFEKYGIILTDADFEIEDKFDF